MARIMVTGGAGFIGSHTVRHLVDAGFEVAVLDNLQTGHRAAVPPAVPLIEISLGDQRAVAGALGDYRPDAVVHFAGSIEAGESMTDPRRFYANNVVNGLHLLDSLVDLRVIPVVFSSSAAVYGEPEYSPLDEGAPKQPTNVYGETKLAFEHILSAYDGAYGLRSISLRYFNACGARPDGSIGADHRNKTHLMTVAMLVALGQRDHIDVYGTDYPTPDGTAIRDYIHVEDLASAHVLAVEALLGGAESDVYNVGVGRGFSVSEVLDSTHRVTGCTIARRQAPRRDGDPSTVVADCAKIAGALGWQATYSDLDEIVATAWRWHSTHPHGFGD